MSLKHLVSVEMLTVSEVLLRTIMLLTPVILIIMGFKSTGVALIGGALVSWFFFYSSRFIADWLLLFPALVGGVLYSFVAFIYRDGIDLFSWSHSVLCVLYALPAGIVYRDITLRSKPGSAVIGLLIISLFLSILICYLAARVGFEEIIKQTHEGVNRVNPSESLIYFKYFEIGNIVINVAYYTIFGLSMIPLLLCRINIFIIIFILSATLICININVMLVARTALFAAILGSLFSIWMIWSSRSRNRILSTKRTAFTGILLLFLGIVAHYVYRDRVHDLWDRFLDSSDDSRLNLWRESLELLQKYPFGGGKAFLTSHEWAHNLFLDVGLTTGFIGVLAIFISIILPTLLIFIRGIRGLILRSDADVYVLTMLFSVFVISNISPPHVGLICLLYFSIGYFSLKVS